MISLRTMLAASTLSLAVAMPALAQAPFPFTTALPNPSVAVQATGDVYRVVKDYLLAAAQQMPESLYSYRPTPTVRTFGQLIGHIAGSQYLFCGAALGNGPSNEGDIEKTVTSKAGLVDALRKSFDACDKAYSITDAAAAMPVSLFGETHARLYALSYNASHDFEHYGNIVTYMRLNGMVPPSSQPAPTTSSK